MTLGAGPREAAQANWCRLHMAAVGGPLTPRRRASRSDVDVDSGAEVEIERDRPGLLPGEPLDGPDADVHVETPEADVDAEAHLDTDDDDADVKLEAD
jgi:hypothetical protein